MGRRLRTFTESVQSEEGEKVKAAVATSEVLLLLGFGYLDQNIQLLAPAGTTDKCAQKVISTAYGISAPDHAVVHRLMKRLAARFTEQLFIEPGTCSDLFKNYDLNLRF